ncbi:hypothetical protein BG011_007065 [Mortierella polycephala]|uniref:Glucosidase 2 subunit beta n=1 Tax=Mortierella polycephala TaxID=41804 RepID=A0A9P6U8Z0_9FUNG|nr:hypothetical protein BG011_007065 [Mortierella polycephala]
MNARVRSIPLLLILAASLVNADSTHNTIPRGVAPSRAKLYLPDNSNNWKCLDGSKTIPFSAVNDDFCDCPDGSDEPGTPACGNGYFYCVNLGHTPAYIKTSRVNDGVCDPECCDGSDEFAGQVQCPNVCEQVGAAAKKERERVRKVQKEGSKIRQGYIAYGKDAKEKLQGQLNKKMAEQPLIQQRATQAKATLDKANAKRQEYLEKSKSEREAARKLQLAPLIEQQTQRLAHANKAKVMFRTTLDELKEKHNKNYHDLAVKTTISGYDEYLEELEKKSAEDTTQKDNDADKNLTADQLMHSVQDQTYNARKDIGAMFQLIKAMKEGYNTEYNDEAVLKAINAFDEFAPSWQDEQNEFVGEEPIVIPADNFEAPKLEEGGADTLYERTQKVAKKVGLGSLFREHKSELESAQEIYNKVSDEERRITNEVQELERKLKMDYGKDETFAQLADQCFELKDIEYTYSLCLFGRATQKSSSDTSLGQFSEWVGNNYDMQLYTGGAKCWNGPERSVKVIMSCGAVNEIVAVSEPAKCEYLFKFSTPAVCHVLSDTEALEGADIITETIIPEEAASEGGAKKHDEFGRPLSGALSQYPQSGRSGSGEGTFRLLGQRKMTKLRFRAMVVIYLALGCIIPYYVMKHAEEEQSFHQQGVRRDHDQALLTVQEQGQGPGDAEFIVFDINNPKGYRRRAFFQDLMEPDVLSPILPLDTPFQTNSIDAVSPTLHELQHATLARSVATPVSPSAISPPPIQPLSRRKNTLTSLADKYEEERKLARLDRVNNLKKYTTLIQRAVLQSEIWARKRLPDEFQHFDQRIPGTLLDTPEKTRRFRQLMNEALDQGRWVYDAQRDYPDFGGATGWNKKKQNERDRDVAIDRPPFPEAGKYHWEPLPFNTSSISDTLNTFNTFTTLGATGVNGWQTNRIQPEDFCRILGPRHIVLVGDMIHWQLHDSIMYNMFDNPQACYGDLACHLGVGHPLCPLPNDVRLKFVRNDLLSTVRPSKSRLNETKTQDPVEMSWLRDMKLKDTVILGATHQSLGDQLFRRKLTDTVIKIRRARPEALIIYRNNPVGHPECPSKANGFNRSKANTSEPQQQPQEQQLREQQLQEQQLQEKQLQEKQLQEQHRQISKSSGQVALQVNDEPQPKPENPKKSKSKPKKSTKPKKPKKPKKSKKPKKPKKPKKSKKPKSNPKSTSKLSLAHNRSTFAAEAKPLDRDIPVGELLEYPLNWVHYDRQNQMAKAIIEASGGIYWNVATMTNMRPDGHIGGQDCLLYKRPGPTDEWAVSLYNLFKTIELAENEIQ